MRRLNILLIGTVFGFTLNQCNVSASLNHPFDGARGLVSNSFFTQLASIALQTPTATATVSGRLLDSSGNPIANATLSVASSSSVRETDSESKTVSTSTRTDTAGNWTLNLRVAVFVISVTSSTGVSLGTITITVTSTSSATAVPASGASFSVTGVTTTPFTNQAVIPKPSITVRYNGVEYKNGDTITITGTKSYTNHPAELTIINNSSANLNLTAGATKAIIGGVNASDFNATNPTLNTLIPGATSTFSVNFNTNTLGEKLADVTVPNDDLTNSNFKLNLKGVLEPKETWVMTDSLKEGRRDHTATLLQNGQVLIVGGVDNNIPLSSAEIYDLLTGKFSRVGSLNTARREHTATLLPNGKVLIAGGFSLDTFSPEQTAELFDPTNGSFSFTSNNMTIGRRSHTATLLPDGKVLIIGGGSTNQVLSSAEIFDPSNSTFTISGSMTTARHRHTSSLLPNGKILVVGGFFLNSNTASATNSAEIYDPNTGSFSNTGSLSLRRGDHTASLINDEVLICGGIVGPETDSVDMYNSTSGTFRQLGRLTKKRGEHTASATSGIIMIVGGSSIGNLDNYTTDIYNPATGSFSIGERLSRDRRGHTATVLLNGNILVIGGNGFKGDERTQLSTAEIYFR